MKKLDVPASPSVVTLLKAGLNDRKIARRHLKAIRNRSPTPPPPGHRDKSISADGAESYQSVRGQQRNIKLATRSRDKRREPWETFRPSHVSIGAAGRLTVSSRSIYHLTGVTAKTCQS